MSGRAGEERALVRGGPFRATTTAIEAPPPRGLYVRSVGSELVIEQRARGAYAWLGLLAAAGGAAAWALGKVLAEGGGIMPLGGIVALFAWPAFTIGLSSRWLRTTLRLSDRSCSLEQEGLFRRRVLAGSPSSLDLVGVMPVPGRSSNQQNDQHEIEIVVDGKMAMAFRSARTEDLHWIMARVVEWRIEGQDGKSA